jgi:DNA-binding transcriptional ArsR family regulator
MKNKLLLTDEPNSRQVKDIAIFDRPEMLKAVLNKLSWQILKLISQHEMYPIEIAKKLGSHEQKVYYHIRKLAQAGVIEVVREEEKKGATAKYYKVSRPAFGVELPYGERKIPAVGTPVLNEKLKQFFTPFLSNDTFDGKIIVGSPDPHGPFKARARDGHYAAYLSLFLGRYTKLPDDFIIKLDVDVKVEKDERNNLILVGGPGTNLLAQEINEHLPIRFSVKSTTEGFLFGGLISQATGSTYTSDNIGLIAKIPNQKNHSTSGQQSRRNQSLRPSPDQILERNPEKLQRNRQFRRRDSRLRHGRRRKSRLDRSPRINTENPLENNRNHTRPRPRERHID